MLSRRAGQPCPRYFGVDLVAEICAAVRPAGAWVHVDGAFGLWAAVAPRRAHLVAGVGEADSWATDAHKWLNVPYDSGLAFVREPDALRAAMAVTADYLPPPGDEGHPSDYTPEISRRARGVEVWAALRTLGRSGLADLVERCCAHARRFAEGFAAAGYEVLNDVVLNQVLVSFGPPEVTRRVVAGSASPGPRPAPTWSAASRRSCEWPTMSYVVSNAGWHRVGFYTIDTVTSNLSRTNRRLLIS